MKRQERPDSDFWDKFDGELRSKQLAALVRTQSWYERLGKLSLLLARKSAAFTATACIFTLGIFTVSKTEFFAGDQSSAVPTATESPPSISEVGNIEVPMFVVDESVLRQERFESDFVPTIDVTPRYEINSLAKKSIPVSYQIISETKMFTAGHAVSGNSLGAKVIRTEDHF